MCKYFLPSLHRTHRLYATYHRFLSIKCIELRYSEASIDQYYWDWLSYTATGGIYISSNEPRTFLTNFDQKQMKTFLDGTVLTTRVKMRQPCIASSATLTQLFLTGRLGDPIL